MSHTCVNWCFPVEDPSRAVERLRKGLRLTIGQLPYMAGHVSRGNEQGFTTLNWTDGDDVELQVFDGSSLPSYAELTAERMCLHNVDHDFRPRGIISRNYVEKPGDSFPATLIACTTVKGGVIVCFCTHHHMVGGLAVVTLLHRWAQNTGGVVPELDAELDALAPLRRFEQVSKALDLKITKVQPAALPSKPPGALPPSPAAATQVSAPEKPMISTTNRIFTLRISQINALRDAVIAETGIARPTVTVMIAAIMWCLITQVREHRKTTVQANGEPAPTTLLMPVPADEIFDKGDIVKSRDFIGNLITAATATDTVANLASGKLSPGGKAYPASLTHAVKRISAALGMALNPQFIKGVMQQICSLPDVRILSSGSARGPNDILVTAWTSFPLFPDFGPGVGRATFIRPATDAVMGESKTNRSFYQYAIVLPRQHRDGEEVIDVLTCFEKGDMSELEKHPLLVRMQRGGARL